MTRRRTIHAQLAPLMRDYGQNALARDTGLHVATINRFINQTARSSDRLPDRLNDQQIDAICKVLGVKVVIHGSR